MGTLLVAGCAPQPDGSAGDPDVTTAGFVEFARSSDQDQVRSLAVSGRALDELVADELDIELEPSHTTGEAFTEPADPPTMTASTASSAGHVLSVTASTRDRSARADVNGAEAAFHNLNKPFQLIVTALTGIDGDQEGYASSGPDDDGTYNWHTAHGATSGGLVRTETSQSADSTIERTIDTQFSASACPSPDGVVTAVVSLGSATTVSGASGLATRTSVNIELAFDVTVSDTAYAEGMLVDLQASMETGAPGSGVSVSEPSQVQNATGRLSFGFGSDGAAGMTDYANSVTPSKTFDRTVEDLAGKAALRLAAQLETYWRSGACVEVTYNHPSEVAPGSTTDLGVDPISKVDGSRIESGTLTLVKSEGEGRVTPEGEQPNPTTFAWVAPSDPGAALITLSATSNRGIGIDPTAIEALQGWEITGTKDGAVHHGLKCDGLVGAWTMNATGDFGFDYEAEIEFELDASLVGPYTATMRVNGISLGDAGQIWLDKIDDQHYTLHSTPYDAVLQVTATNKCAG